VLTIFLGAFAGLLLGSAAEGFLQGLAPVAAGGFLYLALFVLLPVLRRHWLRQGQAAGMPRYYGCTAAICAASQHWRSTSRPRQGRQRQIHTMQQPVVGHGLVFF